jgi:hypothetical protein
MERYKVVEIVLAAFLIFIAVIVLLAFRRELTQESERIGSVVAVSKIPHVFDSGSFWRCEFVQGTDSTTYTLKKSDLAEKLKTHLVVNKQVVIKLKGREIVEVNEDK